MVNMQLDPHFAAAFLACDAVHELIEILPEGDLVDELYELMGTQFELFVHMIEGKHYGTDNLVSFSEYCQEIKKEALRIKESQI